MIMHTRLLRRVVAGLGLLLSASVAPAVARGRRHRLRILRRDVGADGGLRRQLHQDGAGLHRRHQRQGGLLGRKIKAVFADTRSDRAEGAKAGPEVLRQGADVVFGTCDYDFGAPALLQAQKAGKVSIFLCAEDPRGRHRRHRSLLVHLVDSSAGARRCGRRVGLREEGVGRRPTCCSTTRSNTTNQFAPASIVMFRDQGRKDRRSRYLQERRFVDRFADHPLAQRHASPKGRHDHAVHLPARRRLCDSPDPRGRHRPADLQRQLDGRYLLAGRRP